MSSPGTIVLDNVQEIQEDSGNGLFFSRIGECKIGLGGDKDDGCVAVSRTNGVIYLASGTGTFHALRLENQFRLSSFDQHTYRFLCRYILSKVLCNSQSVGED